MEDLVLKLTGPKVLLTSSVVLRLALVLYGDLQDRNMEVKYTDIDYHVFTDAAGFVLKGESPYNRSTYRYTPLLAWLLTPNIYLTAAFGKLLFVVCDVLSGFLIYKILRLRGLSSQTARRFCSLWLLNPLPMGVSSRGNAESILSALVLGTLLCMEAHCLTRAALLYGLAVHMKIYPITYALPVVLTLREPETKSEEVRGGFTWRRVVRFIRSFLSRDVFLFAGLSGGAFCLLTGICYHMYGWEFLHETYLYHLTRRDTRHNFSPYFYMLYLTADSSWSPLLGLAAFLPQLVLLLVTSWSFHSDLSFCCFLHTAIFVSFNKVCTSQYFLWYLCLLPLVLPNLSLSIKQGAGLLTLWFAGQGLWLGPAYFLEFEGLNMFLLIWIAGLFFLIINIFILIQIVTHYRPSLRAPRREKAALKLGLSHVPLANAALDALEDWSSHIPPETMQPCYASILPLLDGYLKTTSTDNKDDSNWEMMSSVSKSGQGFSKVMTRLLKKSDQLSMVRTEWTSEDQVTMDQTLCGGWGQIKDATEAIQIICDQLKPQVETETSQKYETYTAVKFRSQIVTGTNYLIKVHIGGGQYLHLMLYQHFSGKTHLNGVPQHDSKEDPLEPF